MVGAVPNGSLRVVDVAETRQITISREKYRVRRRQQISCKPQFAGIATPKPQFAGIATPRPATRGGKLSNPIAEREKRTATPAPGPRRSSRPSDQGGSSMDTVQLPDGGQRSFLAASAPASAVSLLPGPMASARGVTAIH